jgi:hypothetical protein
MLHLILVILAGVCLFLAVIGASVPLSTCSRWECCFG